MKMTFKTAASIVLAVLGATLHAANTGSSEGSARTITPTRSSQTLAITVTRAYDDCYDVDASGNCKPGYSPDFYTYFVKVVLTKGQTYTFTATYLNDTMYGATPYSPDSSLSPQWDGGDTADGHAYDEFTILASDWNDVEGDTATLYFEFSGDSGGRASLSYKIGVDIPEGTSENPGYLYPGSGFSTATATLTDRHGGQYLYYADLTAGRKYRFLATSGTEAYPVDMNILPSDVSDVDISTETNDGYIITPVESDRYEIQLYTSAPSVALQYGAYPTRPVASHPSTALTPGMRAEFSPGHMNAGDSDYYDTISRPIPSWCR